MRVTFEGVRGSIPTPLTPEQYRLKAATAILQLMRNRKISGMAKGVMEFYDNKMPIGDLFKATKKRNEKTITELDNKSIEYITHYLEDEAIKSDIANLAFGTYGGSTTCMSIITDDNKILVFDAGTGIKKLGKRLVKQHPEYFEGNGPEIYLFLTHWHWDHIHGIPFFDPLIVGKDETVGSTKANRNKINLIAWNIDTKKSIEQRFIDEQLQIPYFPALRYEIKGNIKGKLLISGQPITDISDTITIFPRRFGQELHQKNGICCYKMRNNNTKRIIVFATDVEQGYTSKTDKESLEQNREIIRKIAPEGERYYDPQYPIHPEFFNFIVHELDEKGTDILVMDGMYTKEEYQKKVTFGHNYPESCIMLAYLTGSVKRLILTHHDHMKGPNELFNLEKKAKRFSRELAKKVEKEPIQVELAVEGPLLDANKKIYDF